MKNKLFNLVFASLTLLGGTAVSAEQLKVPEPVAGVTVVQVRSQAVSASVSSDSRASAALPQMQLAVIGGLENRNARPLAPRSAERTQDRTAEPASPEQFPSAASGLAAVLLMICILIGRRNKYEGL